MNEPDATSQIQNDGQFEFWILVWEARRETIRPEPSNPPRVHTGADDVSMVDL